jgi:hypothetical protein
MEDEAHSLLHRTNRHDKNLAPLTLCTIIILLIITLANLFSSGPDPIPGPSLIPSQYKLRQQPLSSGYTIEESDTSQIECSRTSIRTAYLNSDKDRFLNGEVIISPFSSDKYIILENHITNDGNTTLYATGNAQVVWDWASYSIVVNMEGDSCRYKIAIPLLDRGHVEIQCQNSDPWTKISSINVPILRPFTTHFSSSKTPNELYADVTASYGFLSIIRYVISMIYLSWDVILR